MLTKPGSQSLLSRGGQLSSHSASQCKHELLRGCLRSGVLQVLEGFGNWWRLSAGGDT